MKLFEPIRIGAMELPNRIILPALQTGYHRDGSDRFANFMAARARGGAGLIIVGSLMSLYPGRTFGMTINRDEDIPWLQSVTKAIHDNGGRAAAHLATWYYWAKGGEGTPAEYVSPSGVVTVAEKYPQDFDEAPFSPKSRPLTVEEIHMIEEQLADAAVRAQEAGFDAIELAAQAGNLISRFITPYTNRRTDEYGGSVENRLRMLLETIAIIKKRLGDNFPLLCRIPGEDLMPWGLKLDDSKEIAPLIEKAGVHCLDIMPGWYETRQPRHQMCVPRGAFVYLAEGIKQVVNIPVAANGRINDPLLAEQILNEGKADLIAMCRPLVADPNLPNKAKEGRFEDIRLCTACCHCWDSLEEGIMACSVNALAGKEGQYTITPADKPKKVFVIGGGPGGMEAARVAALRGHKVTLFEKQDKLGGQLLYAVLPPYKDEWNALVQYLTTQLHKLGVEVRLNEECTTQKVEEAEPDAVIVATGAVSTIPDIPGMEGENVAMALDVITVAKETGQNVVIVGSELIACETAEFLSRRGRKVTILKRRVGCIGEDIGKWNRWPLMDRLIAAGVRMETGARTEEITEIGVRVTRSDGTSESFEADTVVIATGMSPDDHLAKELEGKVPRLYRIGDCAEPRMVKHAIEEGFEAALQV